MNAPVAASVHAPARGAVDTALPGTPAPPLCENCGTPVGDLYCGHCGQRLEAPVHSLVHFAHTATEDLTHADSRLWSTLGTLLFKPGVLTREFLSGRRARYLPPVRLYLVLSVLFFLIAGMQEPQMAIIKVDTDQTTHKISGAKIYDATAPPRAGETDAQAAERECSGWTYRGPWKERLAPKLPATCRKILADRGRALQESFLHNVPRAMFLFLPLLAGIMMLMYWRPRRYYVEHLLLFLHNHAFAFLVGSLMFVVLAIDPKIPLLQGAVFLYFVWYMYRSMRVVYGQGGVLTAAKLALLAVFYLLFAASLLAITTAYSALTL
jgi:hypothetical protein